MPEPDLPETQWAAVDAWFTRLFARPDDRMAAVLAANAAAGLPAIDVSAPQGKFLAILVTLTRPKQVLEIGTLGGYSTLWMAAALPDGGQITTIEADPHHAATARRNFAAMGCADRITLAEGRGADVLPGLSGPFDLIFIDADKPSNPLYLEEAMRLSRPGSLIVLDNVVRDGGVIEVDIADPAILGTRSALERLAAEKRLSATAIQTVGAKGWDGFAIAVVL